MDYHISHACGGSMGYGFPSAGPGGEPPSRAGVKVDKNHDPWRRSVGKYRVFWVRYPVLRICIISLFSLFSLVVCLYVIVNDHRTGSGREPGKIHIGVTYTSFLTCHNACSVWSGTETISIELPARVPELSSIATMLLGSGWVSAPAPSQFGETRSQAFTRLVRFSQTATPIGFPVTITHRIPIPAIVEGSEVVDAVNGTSESIKLVDLAAGQRREDLIGTFLTVFFIPKEGSKIVLRYPLLAIESTTPASEPVGISGGREERTIDVSEPDAYDEHAATIDVRATMLRESTVATALSLRHTVWIWLIVFAILGFILAAVRRRADLRVDRFGVPVSASLEPVPSNSVTVGQLATGQRRRRRKKR
ncbi:hypothetical protein [Streptosporangium sp. NPDC023615]|uniref:hypothetical protein n=1 Tax=Streptosporangium sp. NPDC023615 TaxID=3154794 RepID=UPI00343FFA5D